MSKNTNIVCISFVIFPLVILIFYLFNGFLFELRLLITHLVSSYWPLCCLFEEWPKENEQRDTQRSTKHTHKTKDRITRTPLSDTRRVNLGTHPGINHECELDGQCIKLPY
jgi:hypothetical protein